MILVHATTALHLGNVYLSRMHGASRNFTKARRNLVAAAFKLAMLHIVSKDPRCRTVNKNGGEGKSATYQSPSVPQPAPSQGGPRSDCATVEWDWGHIG